MSKSPRSFRFVVAILLSLVVSMPTTSYAQQVEKPQSDGPIAREYEVVPADKPSEDIVIASGEMVGKIQASPEMLVPLTGTLNIPGDYATLAAAITDLNTQGVGAGGVTFNVIAGNPQTAPAGGYVIGGTGSLVLTTSSAANPITFTGNSNTITAPTPQTVGNLNDGIFKLIGADFVTIQGFTMQENVGNVVTAAATNTMTEWGVALLYVSTTDGAKNNTIQNNTITLNRAYQNTFGVYSNTRHSSTAIATTAEVTAPGGSNSNNKVYSNNISNVDYGIVFVGASVTAQMDTGNDIGGSALATGNTITNFGWNNTAISGYISVTGSNFCIYLNHQLNDNASFNTITSAAGLATTTTQHGGILKAYSIAAPTAGTVTTTNFNNNTITLNNSPTTGQMTGISPQGMTANSAATINVNNNLITGSVSGANPTSATFIGVLGTSGPGTLSISDNIVRGVTTTATTGGFVGIQQQTNGVVTTLNLNNNKIGDSIAGAVTFSTAANSGAVTGIAVTSTGAASTSTLNMTGNDIRGVVHSAAGSGTHLYYSNAATGSTNISTNTITNITANTTGSVTMISNSVTHAAGTTHNVNNNSIVTGYNKTGAGGTILFYNAFGSSTSAVTETNTGNNFSNMTFTGAATIIGWRSADGTTPGSRKTVTNNTFSNITGGTGAISSILYVGFSDNTFANNNVSGNVISNVSAAASITGILSDGQNQNFFDNRINTLSSTGAAAAVIGVQLTGATTQNVFRNKIYDLQSSDTTGTTSGIQISNGTTFNVYNNLIADLRTPATTATNALNGIILTSTTTTSTINIFFNSIYLNGTSTGTNFGSSAIFHTANATATTATLNLRNNVIVNTSTATGTGITAAYRRSSTTLTNFASTSNNNDFFAPAIFTDGTTTDTTIAAYKARVSPRDSLSFSENPPFLSTTGSSANFLHISSVVATQLESGGAAIAGITDDFDGQVRNAGTPDIGADEFNGILADLSAPVITYTNIPSTGQTTNRVLGVTITDATGVDQSATFAPRIYFKKSSDASYVSTQCSFTSGSATNGTYNCTVDYTLVGGGAVTAGDTIQYFVIAQDTVSPTPNIGSNPAGVVASNVNTVTTAPPPNTYNILPSISGNKTVGSGGDYGTLTLAVAAINAAEVTGPVTLTLIDPSYSAGETFPLVLNANSGSSATNTITIKPGTGVTSNISGSSASCVFAINGADYVTIDGSNTVGGTSRDMTFTNTNAGTTSAVVCIQNTAAPDGATNNTVKNTNVVGNSNTTTLFGIFSGSSTISAASTGTGNNNNRIQNNNLSKTQYGIYSNGASAANKNTGTVITQNLMNTASPDNIQLGGILTGFENNITISENNISNLNTTADIFGISVGLGNSFTTTTTVGNEVTNATVSRNNIGSVVSTSTTGFTAIGIGVGAQPTGSTTTVSNNIISGVLSFATPSDFIAGIHLGGGAGTTNVYFNSVSLSGVKSSGTTAGTSPGYALSIAGTTPVVDVRNNILVNTQTSGNATPGKSFAIGLAYTSVTGNYANLTSNNNDLFVAGAQGAIGKVGSLTQGTGTELATLANWQTETGRDPSPASFSSDPNFVSATDLHIINNTANVSPVARKGVTIAGITTDFDGQTRKATPDIGADEFVTYVLTTTATAGGSVTTPATSPVIVNPVATNIVATPNAGFNFVNWTVTAGTATFGDANQASTTVTPTSDATIQANFVPQNTPPTITPVGVTRQEGSPSSNSTIATVTDDGGNGAVVVTVTSANPNNGVTVSNIVNSGGTVTADVVAACGAVSPATFTLTASDGVLSTNATLTVTVNPNTAPSVTYNNVSTAYLTNTTNPTAAATDNGSIASFALQSQGTYAGGISVNPTSGLVTFTNPTAGGTITIRSTDNCGLFTDSTFTVTVGAAPVFTIDDVTVNEGNSGTTNFTFTVTKTGTTGGNATVDYATAPGTATSPSDYTAITTTTLTFLPAETTKTITVLVNGDTLYENTEDFFVNLTNPVSATIGDNQGLGTITNDDTAPTISITDVTLAEGNSGTTTFGFTVSLSAVSGLPTTVHYQTADGTATTADSDYVAVGDTTLTIPAGQLSVTEGSGPPSNVSVLVNGDIVFETNETFFVNLSNPTNATILDNQGVGTINNDDAAPSYSIDDVSHLEGDSGTTSYVFTVTRTGPTAIASAVTATTADNSATTADNDYQSNTATLNFAASANATSTQTFTVLANGDTVVEPNETFFVNLTNATGGATISDAQGIGTITNDDAVPVVQFSSQAYYEDESQAAVITINRTGDTSGSSTVTYATSGGSANGGAACGGNVDYISIAPTPVTFTAGQTTKTFNVTICGDTNGEYPVDETIGLTLAAVTNASVGTSATLNINDTASQYLQSAASTPAETPHAPIDMTLAQNASPYPSQIVVAGAPTLIGSMRVTLYDVWHLQPDNIDVLLVGPNGQKYLLMADVGGTVTPIPENSPVTITFNDLVSAHLPDAGPLTTGQWQPTVCETNSPFLGVSGSYVTPGCASPNTAAQSMFGVPGTGFGNTNPNGTWMLYVRDDGGSFRPVGAESFSGSIKGGWGLEFIAPTAAELSISGRVLTADGRGITNAVVTVSGGSLVSPVTAIAGRNGTYTVGGLTAGETYIVSVRSRRFAFANPTRLVTLTDNVTDADFTADR